MDKVLKGCAKNNVIQNMPMFWHLIWPFYSVEGIEEHCSTGEVLSLLFDCTSNGTSIIPFLRDSWSDD